MSSVTAVQPQTVVRWMSILAEDVAAQADHLTQLDAAIGDGDHGINMNRGMAAVVGALAEQDDGVAPGRLLIVAGKTLVSTVAARAARCGGRSSAVPAGRWATRPSWTAPSWPRRWAPASRPCRRWAPRCRATRRWSTRCCRRSTRCATRWPAERR